VLASSIIIIMRRPYPFPTQNPYHTMSMSSHPQFYYIPNDYQQYNRKRQRRQAAAVVVESLWNSNSNNTNNINNPNAANNNMGRKSTAQPRPVLHIPPRGIGPIVDPNENDVLCGRGGRINSHAGNVQFRDVINSRKKEYLAPSTKKLEKAHIAAAIVNDIRNMDPPGRFLKEDRDTGLWFDIGDAKAIKKTGQALREDAPDIRPDLDGDDSSGDDKSPSKEEKKTSPKAPPKKTASPPRSNQGATAAAAQLSPKSHTQVWPQASIPVTAHDYQAQAAMPPPFMPSQQQQRQGFQTRSIPIQAPFQNNIYTLPNQLYSGARSVSSKVASVSKQAMEALSQAGPTPAARHQNYFERPPDDIAFGRHFHPPQAGTVLSSDNTMSTISGISDPLSSGLLGSAPGDLKASALMGMSLKSSTSRDPSMRLSSLSNLGIRPSALGFSGLSSARSANGNNSLSRSMSFNDMNSVAEGDAWKAILEADDSLIDEAAAKSILSGNSGRAGQRNSSGMSIGGMSMDLASTASSTQWLAAAGLGGSLVDDKTIMSGMSNELDALDLASVNESLKML
jgi:hypothetical protein